MKKFQALFAMLFVALFLIMPAKGITPAEKKLYDALKTKSSISCTQGYDSESEYEEISWNIMPNEEPTTLIICNIDKLKGKDIYTVLVRANENFETYTETYKHKNEHFHTFLGWVDIIIDGDKAIQYAPAKINGNGEYPMWEQWKYPVSVQVLTDFHKLDMFWKSVQAAVAKNDAKALANMIEYTFTHPFNREVDINNTKDFHQYFKSIFTNRLKDYIKYSVIGFPFQEDSDLDGCGKGVTRVYSYRIVKNEIDFTLYINVDKINGTYKISSINWQN